MENGVDQEQLGQLFYNGFGPTVAIALGSMKGVHQSLERFSQAATTFAGSSWAFLLAGLAIVAWAVTGPFVDYSETWQLVINTSTTIVTFLMVFLIQRSQNKESLAVQLKLNELLASQEGASNRMINIEDLSEDDIRQLHQKYSDLVEELDRHADTCHQHSIEEGQSIPPNVRQGSSDLRQGKRR